MNHRDLKRLPDPTAQELYQNLALMGALRRLQQDPLTVIQSPIISEELDRLCLVRPVGVGRVVTPKGERLLTDARNQT